MVGQKLDGWWDGKQRRGGASGGTENGEQRGGVGGGTTEAGWWCENEWTNKLIRRYRQWGTGGEMNDAEYRWHRGRE